MADYALAIRRVFRIWEKAMEAAFPKTDNG